MDRIQLPRKVAIVFLAFQLIAMLFHSATVINAASIEMNLKAKYVVQIKEGGLVVINATIDLRNNGTLPISTLEFGFVNRFDPNLDKAIAFDSLGLELSVDRLGINGNISWIGIGFGPVEHNQMVTFSVLLVFSGLIDYNGTAYTVSFPQYPILSYDIELCIVEVSLPKRVTAQSSSLDGLLTESKAPLKANSTDVGFVTFTGNVDILECAQLTSEVVVDPWGSQYFYDSYRIQNIGWTNLNTIAFTLPSSVEDVSAYDIGGTLTVTVADGDLTKAVVIHLRYPLRGTYRDACTFTIKYRLKTTTSSWTRYTFSGGISSSVNLTITKFALRVTLPEGAKYVDSSHNNDLSTIGLTTSIDYDFQNVTPVDVSTVTIDYDYLVLWAGLRPAVWIGGILVLTASYTLYRRRRRGALTIVLDENVKQIRTFTDLCDERLILWADIDSLEEDFDNNRMRRRDYNRRQRILTQRLRSVERTLTNMKNDVRQIEPRYAKLIDQIERAEMDITTLQSNIAGLRTQYRTRRLSRRTYQQLKNDYEKRAEDAKRVIERAIIEIKSRT